MKAPKWYRRYLNSLTPEQIATIHGTISALARGTRIEDLQLTPKSRTLVIQYCDVCLAHTPIHEERDRKAHEIVKNGLLHGTRDQLH